MAQLILTEAEQSAALWTDLDDAALGALLRKKISFLQTAAEQMDRTVGTAAALLLCCAAAEENAQGLAFDMDGVTQDGRSFGDWTVQVTRKAQTSAGASAPAGAVRQSIVDILAGLVAAQAEEHGFAIEVDAIRGAVEQSAKFANLSPSEEEILQACLKVEQGAGLEPVWENDGIQFMRLLSEILAVVEFSGDQMSALAESMDLEQHEIVEVLERADLAWEKHKGNLPATTTLAQFRGEG